MIYGILLNILILISSNVHHAFRLPTNLKPELYYLEVKTFLEPELRFEGEVKIRFKCENSTSDIVLHSRELNIAKPRVSVTRIPSGDNLGIKGHTFNLTNHFYIINLERNLEPGSTYLVSIPFRAPLGNTMVGYYKSSYKDSAGRIRWLAVTKFEPLDARRAFPCFDEPAMKARFRISLVRPNKFSSISNMPLVFSQALAGGWTRDVFAETMPMSTYLVAYVISEFTSLTTINNNRMFRVWARPSAIHQANYTLQIGPKIIDFFEDYFGVDYAFPKMDFIAVPDFGSGAMENWGLCTYREVAMLYDETSSSALDKEHVTRVVAHEIAHQWFGNLVTMQFWDDLWLNEGFATYVTILAVAHVQPDWNAKEELALRDILGVIDKDALHSSRAVSATIKQASDIPQMFDPITYMKGSVLLRMLHNFLGENTFRRGVARYLHRYQFKNAKQDQLWECFDEQVKSEYAAGNISLVDGTSLKQIMDSWTLQLGYPVLQVRRGVNPSSIAISQSRYLIDGSAPRSASVWWVPLSYVSAATQLQTPDPRPYLWVSNTSAQVPEVQGKWILLNLGNYALVRVNYGDSDWRAIFTALQDANTRAKIPRMTRAQLLSDAFDLAQSGHLSYEVALDSLQYLRHERDNVPWRAALTSLNFLSRMTRRSQANLPFRRILQLLLTPIYSELGNNPFQLRSSQFSPAQIELLFPSGFSEVTAETLPEIKYRRQILKWCCSLEVSDSAQRASNLFRVWQQSADPDKNNPVPVNLRSVVYCSGVRHGGETAWQFTWNRYLAANVGAEKDILLSALGCTNNTDILHRYVISILEPDSGIRKQDALEVFRAVAKGSGFYVALDFLETNINQLHSLLQPKTSGIGRYFLTVADSMNTEYDLELMRDLINTNSALLSEAWNAVQQTLETVQLNVQWKKNRLREVIEWCEKNINKFQ